MSARILVGDVRERLRDLPDGSVRTVVTSPPYWGLRDYGTASWDGGDPKCSHLEKVGGTGSSTLGAASGGNDMSDAARERSTERSFVPYRKVCAKCGAVRTDHQIGLEDTPELYVQGIVEVFREVRRVLADDGTLWLNLGDSYNAQPGQRKETDKAGAKQQSLRGSTAAPSRSVPTLKPKDLVGIPWRVAFALQADGWYLRQDIIWAKPNPMPESVRDRCTKAHEYVFLLTKSARYSYDADAVREPNVSTSGGPWSKKYRDEQRKATSGGDDFGRRWVPEGRNRRSVWTVPTKSFRGAHFAVMPEALVEPCVLAGSAAGDTVLDPFCGSGTVGVVALRHGREFVGIDLNPEYAAIARDRIASDSPLLNLVEVVA